MPTTTTDQGIDLPVDADTADNPVAFANFVADVEVRLVRSYTDTADRTTRMAVLAENAISTLATENRAEIYNGTDHISLHTRALHTYSRVSTPQLLTISNTTLQNLASLLVAVPGTTGAIFGFRGKVFYDSATAADIKFAFTIPAGATFQWGLLSTATNGTSPTFTSTTVSGTALAAVGLGVGTLSIATFEGEITMGATAGNLQMQAAQNTSDATQSTVGTRSSIEAWRIS